MPVDILLIAMLVIGATATLASLRGGSVELASSIMTFTLIIAVGAQIFYEGSDFTSLSFYWIAAIFVGFYSFKPHQLYLSLIVISIIWTLAFLFDNQSNANLGSLIYRLVILYVAGLGSHFFITNMRVLASEKGRIEAQAESRRRITMMQISSQITANTFARRNLEEVLERVVEDIRQQYEQIYHAQVFLMNKEGTFAELRASTGEVGKELIARGHKLAVGSQSVIGQVTATKRFVIAESDKTDTIHKRNELLPNTRTELALPLLVNQNIIGVLDLQSQEPSAFTQEDVEVFQVLADQIALAIDNASLITQLREKFNENERLLNAEKRNRLLIENYNRELSGQAWAQLDASQLQQRLDLKTGAITPLTEISERAQTAMESGDIQIDQVENSRYYITLPVKVNDAVVAALEFEVNRPELPRPEILGALKILSERLGRSAENVRLFQQTQQALTEVERLYRIAQVANLASDATLEDIYKAVVEQLIVDKKLDTVAILLAHPLTSVYTANLNVVYLWERQPNQSDWVVGEPLDYLRRGFSTYFEHKPSTTLYFKDRLIARSPEEQVIEDIMDALHARTLFAAPMVLGEKWFGVLICASQQANTLTSNFRNFAQTAANQLALTIDNRRLFEEAQKEAQRAFVLAEAGQQIAGLRGDVQSKIGHLFRALAGPAEFDYWWLGVVDEKSSLIIQLVEGQISSIPSINLPKEVNTATDDNSIVEAVQVNQVILVNDPEDSQSMLSTWKAQFGKHVVVPLNSADEQTLGVLLLGRLPESRDFDERDIQFVTTFASQLAVAFENQRLFTTVENQRQIYDEILSALPTGVIVFNTDLTVSLVNAQARALMGEGIQNGFFASGTYPIYDPNTNELYTPEDFPPLLAIQQGQAAVPQTFYTIREDKFRIDLLLNTAVMYDEKGNLESTIVTLQDVSELRELEAALQASLSETTALYEASRSVAEASTKDELINALMRQLSSLEPDHIYLLFREGQDDGDMYTAVVGVYPQDLYTDDLQLSVEQLPLPTSILMSEEQLIVEDVEKAQLPAQDIALLHTQNISSFSVFPLIARGERIIGWFTVAFKDRHSFPSEERRLLATLAAQVSVALDVLRLFESTQLALRSLSKLYRGNRRTISARSSLEAAEIVREELLGFNPNRIDIIIQRSAEDFENLDALLVWASERSLEDIPSLPIDPITLTKLTDYDPLDETISFIEDTQHPPVDELHQALLTIDTTYRAIVSLPLQVGGRTIGRLAMGFLTPQIFNNDDRQFVEILSDALAFVVSNEQLFAQTQDSLEETGVLYQASRAIVNAETREEVLQAMIDYAASATVDKVMLVRLISQTWDDPNALAEITTTWGRGDFLDLKGLRFTPSQLPIWDAISSESIFYSDNVDEDSNIDEFTRLGLRTLDIASFVVVPLKTANRHSGAILLGSSLPRQHSDREIRIYSSLADQASITLENMMLLEQAAVRTRQLEISAQVSQSATQILNLDELFPQIVNQIKISFNYDHAQIFLIDDLGENAVLKAATGESGQQMLAINHSLPVGSSSVVGQASGTGQPFLVNDTSEQGVVHRPNPYLPDTRAELAVPLKVKGTIVGVLDVQSNTPNAFNQDDITALTSLADQLAIAIENARLFEISQKRASDMGFLFEITSTAASATGSLGETLETLATELIRQMKGHGIEIFLKVEGQDVLQSQVLIVSKETEAGIEYQYVDSDSTIPIGFGLIGWVARHQRPIVINDFAQEQEYLPSISSSRSGIFVPLSSGSTLVGVVAIEGARPYQYDDEDLRLLITLSSTLTPIIQNVLLVEELQRTNERLREIDQLKTNFLASMSHELRTPLNSIIGFSRVILKGIDGPITEMQRQDIQTIHDSGKHLLGLVNDILDQAKIEAGKMELVKEYFDLTAVVKSLMSTAQGLIKDKPIQLFTEIANNLPNAYGDEFRTRQIILNILGNAAKFTYEGSITVSVYLDEYKPKGRTMLVVSVADTGVGIAEKDLPKIFESFQQLDSSTTRTAEGTGLGLPLANSFAELQGGGIEVESELGAGSTFRVYIPIEPIENDIEEKTEPSLSVQEKKDTGPLPTSSNDTDETLPKRPTKELRRRVILVIDDEVSTVNLYRRYLSKEGWQVVGVTDASRAEEMIAAHAPQMILLDINMPNRQGWDVLEKIRSLGDVSDIPVIVCSVETDTQRSTSLGAQLHIVKPIEEQTLLEAVRTIEKQHLS